MIKVCEQCHDEFEAERKERMFCSLKCSSLSHKRHFTIRQKHDTLIQLWLDNKHSGHWIGKNNELHPAIREWLKQRSGEKCELCGWAEVNKYTGKIPLQVHHIDGDSKNCRPENLQYICPNCHSLTKNYGSRNKGNGRQNRRSAGLA